MLGAPYVKIYPAALGSNSELWPPDCLECPLLCCQSELFEEHGAEALEAFRASEAAEAPPFEVEDFADVRTSLLKSVLLRTGQAAEATACFFACCGPMCVTVQPPQ